MTLHIKANTQKFGMPCHRFTKAARELFQLIDSEVPFPYLEAFAESIKNYNVDVKLEKMILSEDKDEFKLETLHKF